MTRWHAGAVAIVLAATVAVAMGQGTKQMPLFTQQQAAQCKKLYAAKCAMCHGDTLQGGVAGPLAGPAFAAAWTRTGLVGDWANSQFTVEDLDFIIRTTMPKGAAGQMASDDYTAVLTYILQQNGYEAGSTTPLRAGSPRMKQERLRFGITKELAAVPPPLRVAGDASAVPKSGGPTQEELIRAAGFDAEVALPHARLFRLAVCGTGPGQ